MQLEKTNQPNKEISFREVFHIFSIHKFTLIGSILFSIFVCYAYLIIVNPIYTSTGSILIEDSNSTMTSLFDMGIGSNANFLENEKEILKSRTTAERTIKSLLDSNEKNNMFIFGTRKYAGKQIEDYGFFPGKGLKGLLRGILLLDSNEKVKDISKIMNDSLFNEIVDNLRENLVINNLRNTDVITVSYSNYDPNEASLIVNTVMSEYIKRDQEWASGEMSHLKEFLDEQLEFKKTELDAIEKELQIFQEEEHIYGLDDNSDLLLNQLTEVESKYHSHLATKNILIERRKWYSNQLSVNEREYAQNTTNTINLQLADMREELAKLETELLLSNKDDDHPVKVNLKFNIDNLKKIINNNTRVQIEQGISKENPFQKSQALLDSVFSIDASIELFSSKLVETEKLVKKYELELSSLPSKYLKFSKLQRDKIILDETYGLMKQKYEEARITGASQLGKVRIIDSSVPVLDESFPNKKMLLVTSIFIGLMFGILIVVIYEYTNSTIKSIEELERKGLNVLSIVPAIGDDANKRITKKRGYKFNLKLNKSEQIERRLLTHEDPKSPISESYRSLRTSLMFNYEDKKSKFILVSSSGPGEGKTTTVANLAITYANMGRKTLLIDADLRKPVIHKMFNLDKKIGLTSYLSGSIKVADEIISKTEVDNFYVAPSGIVPPNPSEILMSDKMTEFVKYVSQNYDIILFDSPPLIAVTDALILKKYSDQFIMVVRASRTEKGALDRVLVNLNNVEEEIDGVVFNGVDESNSYGGAYYYNYYQYYYGEDK